MSYLLNRLIELEADVRYQEPAAENEPEFRYCSGSLPVLLSAPHGAVHLRLGLKKWEDEYTAGFARLIAEHTSAHVIYNRRKSLTDPNWYPEVPYKKMLEQEVAGGGIGFIMDLHGARPSSKFGIALGTMRGKSCPDHRPLIIRELAKHGFSPHAKNRLDRLDIDRKFTATGILGQETITRFAWEKLNIPAAQFELNAYLRDVGGRNDTSGHASFHGDSERIIRAVYALENLVSVIAHTFF